MPTPDQIRAHTLANAAVLAGVRDRLLGDAAEIVVVMSDGDVMAVTKTWDEAEEWAANRLGGRSYSLHRVLRTPPHVPHLLPSS